MLVHVVCFCFAVTGSVELFSREARRKSVLQPQYHVVLVPASISPLVNTALGGIDLLCSGKSIHTIVYCLVISEGRLTPSEATCFMPVKITAGIGPFCGSEWN